MLTGYLTLDAVSPIECVAVKLYRVRTKFVWNNWGMKSEVDDTTPLVSDLLAQCGPCSRFYLNYSWNSGVLRPASLAGRSGRNDAPGGGVDLSQRSFGRGGQTVGLPMAGNQPFSSGHSSAPVVAGDRAVAPRQQFGSNLPSYGIESECQKWCRLEFSFGDGRPPIVAAPINIGSARNGSHEVDQTYSYGGQAQGKMWSWEIRNNGDLVIDWSPRRSWLWGGGAV